MNNDSIGSAIAKIVALTGGALAGAILANWLDKMLSERLHERSDRDRKRYAQGLTPQSQDKERSASSQPRIIRIEPLEPSEETRDSWDGL
jgi:hypothetical protein